MKKPDFMTYEQWLAVNPDMAALHDEDPEPCEECNGDGTLKCMKCLGEGTITCIECNGIGSVKGETEEIPMVECFECQGNGLATCPDCDGEAHYTCEECDGTGGIDPALAIYKEQLLLDKQKFESFQQFHKKVTGKELAFNNT